MTSNGTKVHEIATQMPSAQIRGGSAGDEQLRLLESYQWEPYSKPISPQTPSPRFEGNWESQQVLSPEDLTNLSEYLNPAIGEPKKLHPEDFVHKNIDVYETGVLSLAFQSPAFMRAKGGYICRDRHTGVKMDDFQCPIDNDLYRMCQEVHRDWNGAESLPFLREHWVHRIKMHPGFLEYERDRALERLDRCIQMPVSPDMEQRIVDNLGSWLVRSRVRKILNQYNKRIPPVEELIEELKKAWEAIPAGFKSKLKEREFNIEEQPPVDRVLYALGGVAIGHPGNLVTLTGPIKSGKSALVAAFLASPMAGPNCDLLGLTADNNDRGLALIHIDTEQSRFDHDRLVRNALRRAGRLRPPPWFHSYCLTGWAPAEIREVIESELKRAQEEHGGAFAVILDGVGDIVTSPNDEQESFAAVTVLHDLAIRYDTAVVTVLHLNPDGGKTRGHLGSHLERKSETVLRMEKKDEIVTVWSQCTRGAPITKSRGPRFKFCAEVGMHVSVEPQAVQAETAKNAELRALLRHIWTFGSDGQMSWTEMTERIQAADEVSPRTAERRLEKLLEIRLVEKSGESYVLTSGGRDAVGPRPV